MVDGKPSSACNKNLALDQTWQAIFFNAVNPKLQRCYLTSGLIPSHSVMKWFHMTPPIGAFGALPTRGARCHTGFKIDLKWKWNWQGPNSPDKIDFFVVKIPAALCSFVIHCYLYLDDWKIDIWQKKYKIKCSSLKTIYYIFTLLSKNYIIVIFGDSISSSMPAVMFMWQTICHIAAPPLATLHQLQCPPYPSPSPKNHPNTPPLPDTPPSSVPSLPHITPCLLCSMPSDR